ncbi:MAG: hypothetical protein AAGG02_12120 [Cyanobacteria bacterium P01_H01_bin.15]
MVRFTARARPSFWTIGQIEEVLQQIFQRDVDVITRKSVERSRNNLRRKEILSSCLVICESQPTVLT